jgi:pimeloyl-ACP methyl ester carboxylesterase
MQGALRPFMSEVLSQARRCIAWAGLMVVAGAFVGCGGSVQIATESHTVRADDGFPLQAYRLFEWNGSKAVHEDPRGVVYYVQGSENVPVQRATDRLAGVAIMGFDLVMLERRGVSKDGTVDETVARRFETKPIRVADELAVIRDDLSRRKPGGPVILFGTSEGGDVAAAVAAMEPRVTHVILMGCGGWAQAEELRELVRRDPTALGIDGAELEAALADIQANSETGTMWLGHPYRRWGSYLFDAPLHDLLKVGRPILVMHGDADRSVPVESARALRDAFQKAGKPNLTYREYVGVDHRFMHAETGRSAHPLVEVDVVSWLAELGVLDPRESKRFVDRVRKNHPGWYEKGAP